MALSPDEEIVIDEFGPDFGMQILERMRPLSVSCPERVCRSPIGACCMTAGGAVRDEPHSSRARKAERTTGKVR